MDYWLCRGSAQIITLICWGSPRTPRWRPYWLISLADRPIDGLLVVQGLGTDDRPDLLEAHVPLGGACVLHQPPLGRGEEHHQHGMGQVSHLSSIKNVCVTINWKTMDDFGFHFLKGIVQRAVKLLSVNKICGIGQGIVVIDMFFFLIILPSRVEHVPVLMRHGRYWPTNVKCWMFSFEGWSLLL